MRRLKNFGEAKEEKVFNVFMRWIDAKKAEGVTNATIDSYKSYFIMISVRLDVSVPIDRLTEASIKNMILKAQDGGLSSATIRGMTATLKSFLHWCRDERLSDLDVKLYKADEAVKETYTDEELVKLLKKPDVKKCGFVEYRCWVIINLLLNSGMRSGTLREILIKDVDMDNSLIYFRHNKNRKQNISPMSSTMRTIMAEYLQYRSGNQEDYLFCSETGEQLTKSSLAHSIRRYNTKRGVQLASLHAFRHTFAKKFILDCHGDAFTLQRLLGHSTLDTTKKYMHIYDADLINNYDAMSPLEKLSSSCKKKIVMDKIK